LISLKKGISFVEKNFICFFFLEHIKMGFIHQFLDSIDSQKVYDLFSSDDGMSCEPTKNWLPLSPTKELMSGLRGLVLKYRPLGKRG
jgi:hypothetical protein